MNIDNKNGRTRRNDGNFGMIFSWWFNYEPENVASVVKLRCFFHNVNVKFNQSFVGFLHFDRSAY